MASILTDVTSFVTAAVGWIGDFVDVIVAQPLLEMFVITSFVVLVSVLSRPVSTRYCFARRLASPNVVRCEPVLDSA